MPPVVAFVVILSTNICAQAAAVFQAAVPVHDLLTARHLSTVIILYYVRYYILSEPSTNSFRWMKSGVDRKM